MVDRDGCMRVGLCQTFGDPLEKLFDRRLWKLVEMEGLIVAINPVLKMVIRISLWHHVGLIGWGQIKPLFQGWRMKLSKPWVGWDSHYGWTVDAICLFQTNPSKTDTNRRPASRSRDVKRTPGCVQVSSPAPRKTSGFEAEDLVGMLSSMARVTHLSNATEQVQIFRITYIDSL